MRRRVRIFKVAGRWCWICSLCQPEVHGSTTTWGKSLRNVQRHCTRTRYWHHAWVKGHKP